MPKKFFWIKLKDSFFKQLAIKKLRKVAGGDTFVIIYLKMMLLSMNNEGKICFECNDGSEFAENLALELDEQEDNVSMTLGFLKNHGLIEYITDGEVFLPEVIDCIGSESESAERVRKHREIKKTLQCNTDVTPLLQDGNKNVTLEKEIEREKEIDIEIEREYKAKPKRTRKKKDSPKIDYASSVRLTETEYEGFIAKYGQDMTLALIDILNNYKEQYHKKYDSDAAAIRNWVVDAYYERANKAAKRGGIGVAEAAAEVEKRLGVNNGNDDNTNGVDPVWGVWAE